MKKKSLFLAMLGMVLALGMAFVGCDNGSTSGGGDGEELLEVTHVNGFQGSVFNNGIYTFIEIEVPSTADGNQNFTLYINGANSGTGTLTLSDGSITALTCSNASLTYSGGVRYSGVVIQSLRIADNKILVHWGVYYYTTMNDFNTFAQSYGGDAQQMYSYRPTPDEQGYYPSGGTSYDTPRNIYIQACQDDPSNPPPISVLNQAIRVLNNHRNIGVGAYESAGDLIAYYFRRM